MARTFELKPLAIGVLIGVAATWVVRAGAQQAQPAPAPAAPPAAAPVGDRYQITAGDTKTLFVLDKQNGAVYQFSVSADGFWTPGQGFSIPTGLRYLEQGPQGDHIAPGRR